MNDGFYEAGRALINAAVSKLVKERLLSKKVGEYYVEQGTQSPAIAARPK
jgi:hypothetical protein